MCTTTPRSNHSISRSGGRPLTAWNLPTSATPPDPANSKEPIVTTRGNDRNTTRNLPATPGPEPPSGFGRPEPYSHAPSPDAPGQLDLAGLDQRKYWERRMRRELADAEHWMQTRIKHPDGGERTVAETLADEQEQRKQINHETAMGSRKHRRLLH
jgi:hypothetical protein